MTTGHPQAATAIPAAHRFEPSDERRQPLWADVAVFAVLVLVLLGAVQIALGLPATPHGKRISLSPMALPYYSILSLLRLTAAYGISLALSFIFGYVAVRSKRAERLLIPLLDVLQSVPLLSFLPVVMLSFNAIFPERMAIELASIVLIVTCQAWNIAFCWYQSLITLPTELQEAGRMFGFSPWLRFQTLELPFAAIKLVWNSMMSWANGWFFLMAAEIFTVGDKDFRVPGLGAYLQEAAQQGDTRAMAWGVAMLIFLIVLLDQLLWRPMLAWVERFKYETMPSEFEGRSWFYEALRRARATRWIRLHLLHPLLLALDEHFERPRQISVSRSHLKKRGKTLAITVIAAAGSVFIIWRGLHLLGHVSRSQWLEIAIGLGATFLRVMAALLITLIWTVPVGIAIGSNRQLARWLQPIVQITASVPATALFPILVLFMLKLPGGLNVAAVILILLGTQWYMLFNIIGGASVIPQDLHYTASLLGFNRRLRWRYLTFPALFPYLVTGAIVTTGGAWNACIVAEYIQLSGKTFQVTGIGAVIANATADGNYALLAAATIVLIATVLTINRWVWRILYDFAQNHYRSE